MKILAFAVVSLAVLCLMPFALGQLVERYNLTIVEKESPFMEQIEIDEKQDIEVFRVPAHNDVNAADFYHDFKMRVTVTKVLSRKSCYIADMDPSMPAPKKLEADLAQAASQPAGKLPLTTQEQLVLIIGPANRLELTREILDFCGALPIYKTKTLNDPVKDENGTLSVRTTTRQKRQTSFRLDSFTSCLASQGQDPIKYVIAGGCLNSMDWDLVCKVKDLNRNVFFYVTCREKRYWPTAYAEWLCSTKLFTALNVQCCDYRCPIRVN